MRSVGLDLGARHIAFCEVRDGEVVKKMAFRRLSDLKAVLGPDAAPARVAFEACREGWHVHDKLKAWGHEPLMVDTTRVRRLGIGQHGRKNDAIDAEVIALAVEQGRLPLAHVLSPARRALRAKLSVRGELVDMRKRQVTIIRGLARAAGTPLPSSATSTFRRHVNDANLDKPTLELVAPLLDTLEVADKHIAALDAELAQMVADDPLVTICTSAPGVGVIVAATYISVLDEAKRFRNADAVASYFGLAPSEATTGGTQKRRLGGITKQGNRHARTMLVQAAWSIMRTNGDDPLRRWASQVATRRGKKIAAIALARRLAMMLWAMCRDGTFYDSAALASKSAKGFQRNAQQSELVEQAMETIAAKLERRTARYLKMPAPKKPSKKNSPLEATA
jgi:transposase